MTCLRKFKKRTLTKLHWGTISNKFQIYNFGLCIARRGADTKCTVLQFIFNWYLTHKYATRRLHAVFFYKIYSSLRFLSHLREAELARKFLVCISWLILLCFILRFPCRFFLTLFNADICHFTFLYILSCWLVWKHRIH